MCTQYFKRRLFPLHRFLSLRMADYFNRNYIVKYMGIGAYSMFQFALANSK